MGKKSKKKTKKKRAMVNPKPVKMLETPVQKVEQKIKIKPMANAKLTKPPHIDKDALIILDINSPQTAFEKHPIENISRLSLTYSETIPSSYYCLDNPVDKEEKDVMNLPSASMAKLSNLRSMQSTISFIESLHGRNYKKAIFEFSE